MEPDRNTKKIEETDKPKHHPMSITKTISQHQHGYSCITKTMKMDKPKQISEAISGRKTPPLDKNLSQMSNQNERNPLPQPAIIRETNPGENQEDLVLMMTKRIQISNYIDESRFIPPDIIEGSEFSTKSTCQNCRKIGLKFKLECGHLSCIFCLKVSINCFNNEATLANYKKTRCRECSCIPNNKELGYLLCSSDSEMNMLVSNKISAKLERLLSLQINKKCAICDRNLSLLKDFLSDLRCLHLCKGCYAHYLVLNFTACPICHCPFNNKELTLKRKELCVNCRKYKLIVKDKFLGLGDNYYCYECVLDYVNQENCDKLKSELRLSDIAYKKLINELCPRCGKYFDFKTIRMCVCLTISCNDCWERDPYCSLCKEDSNN